MADFHIDNELGSSGNDGSSELLPKQLLSEATFSANNRVLCKRGQSHPLGAYRFLASGMTLTAYGTGRRPIIRKTAGNDAWIYVQNASNVTLEHFEHDCTGYNGNGIALTTGSGHAISNVTIRDVDVYGAYGSGGLTISGAGGGTIRSVTVEDSAFYSNRNHGTICLTDAAGVTYERCRSYANGSAVGAHNFSAYAASSSPAPTRIAWLFCEGYGCVDFDGIEGTGVQADDNATYCRVVGGYFHDNEGSGVSFNSSSNHTVMGTLSVRNGKPGLYLSNGATNCNAYNNTMTGNCTRGTFVGEVVSGGNATGFTSRNNVYLKDGSATVGISLSAGSASGSTSNYDCIYGYATVTANITATNTQEVDPLLDASYRPRSGSPVIGAGTYLYNARHMGGKRMSPVSPDIGAYQYTEPRAIALARAVSGP